MSGNPGAGYHPPIPTKPSGYPKPQSGETHPLLLDQGHYENTIPKPLPPGPGYQIPPQARPAHPIELERADSEVTGGYSEPPIAVPVNFSKGGTIRKEPKTEICNISAGLEYLKRIDHIFIKQKVELSEAFFGFEGKNKYKIMNLDSQIIYLAEESTDCCTRNCFGSLRPFEIKVKDKDKREVIRLSRPFACSFCCFPCILQSVEVFSPPDVLVGRVDQELAMCQPAFSVKDAHGETILRIQGPFCTFSFCGNVEFKILGKEGDAEVKGKISKRWGGITRETFTDADNFGLSFPEDLDVEIKAVLIGAGLLIDFMYFENKSL